MFRTLCKALRRVGEDARKANRKPVGAAKAEYLIIIVCASLFLLAVIQLFGGGLGNVLQGGLGVLERAVEGDSAEVASRPSSERGSSVERSGTRRAEGATTPSDTQENVKSGAPSQGEAGVVRSTQQREGPPAAKGSVGGINPVVWFIALFLFLLLGYVVFGEKKG